jgi:fibronectin type III domain protein
MPVYKDLRAKVGWTRMSHSDFRGFLWKIYVYNVHNPHFSNPPIRFPDFLVCIQDFEAAIIDAETGSKIARAERDKTRLAAAKMATPLGHYVTAAAKGDQAIFDTSGFENIPTSRKKRQQPDIPQILKLAYGPNSGTINVWLSPSNRLIDAYHLRYGPVDSPGGVDTWPVEPITSSNFPYMVSNLTPAVRYVFQAAALGADGWTDFCDPVTIIVV